MSQAPLILIGIIALSFFDVSFYSGKMILDLFLSMPASRKHEAEADFIGLMMMAQGCYRPEAAMELWRRMEETGQHGPPQQGGEDQRMATKGYGEGRGQRMSYDQSIC
jgi:Zn-dependent protease with chaperone function